MLFTGTRLGPYEILALIGAGGMGEVYRARDTRLNRDVAIKVAGERFSDRFEREARSIAALNHPNICTLHDVGANYLVMELVEGETLAARLDQGPLPLEVVLRCGAEIASALAAAHSRGIVHRDLKPGNIMLTKHGVKVLDFGLAKTTLVKDLPPTEAETITASNVVMGTPAYMAPEQREGKACESRTDIYALGLILFEMATGKRAPKDHPLADQELPIGVGHIIERCLARDPIDRWQASSDVKAELEWVGRVQLAPVSAAGSFPSRWVLRLAAAAALGALAAGIPIYLRHPRAELPVQFSMPGDPVISAIYSEMPSPSPDGRRIAYPQTDSSGRRQLWLRSLESESATSLAGTEDALYPFWSPDGRWIGFYAQGKLKKVGLDGSNSQTIVAVTGFDGSAAWSSTHEIVYAPGNRTPLFRISDSGGTFRQITKLDDSRGENSHRWVRFLPDGKSFLFSARCANRENNALYRGRLDTEEIFRIGAIQSNVAYVPGLILFCRESGLYQQDFDGKLLSGEARRIADVDYRPISIRAFFDVSMNGRLLISRPPTRAENRLTWIDRTGRTIGTLGPAGEYIQPRISPDGSRVMFNRPDDNGGNRDVWSIEILRGISARLTVDPANEWNEVWAPDGRRILFASDRNGRQHGSMFEKVSLEPGVGEHLVPGVPDFANPEDWSNDGRWIAFVNGGSHGDIWIVPTFGPRTPFQFVESRFEVREPRFSPDVKWLAYSSNESGQFEVYVRPFTGLPSDSTRKVRVSERGGFYPAWSRQGKELFFVAPDSQMYVIATKELEQVGRLNSPQPIFKVCAGNTPTGNATQGRNFDLAPNGQFLFVCGSQMDSTFTVTANWNMSAPRSSF